LKAGRVEKNVIRIPKSDSGGVKTIGGREKYKTVGGTATEQEGKKHEFSGRSPSEAMMSNKEKRTGKKRQNEQKHQMGIENQRGRIGRGKGEKGQNKRKSGERGGIQKGARVYRDEDSGRSDKSGASSSSGKD